MSQLIATTEKIWKCSKCGRVFENRQGLAGHYTWCGRDTTELRKKIAENNKGSRNPSYGKTHSAESRQRMSDALTGRQLSKEHRQMISDRWRGKPLSSEHKQKLAEANRGKTHSAEHKQKLSDAQRGNKCHNWKGGTLPYGSMWPLQRRRARVRDNFTCQRCGITEEELGHELSVHHIRSFRESTDHSTENLICLCDTNDNGCHVYCERHPEECPEPRKHWLLTA